MVAKSMRHLNRIGALGVGVLLPACLVLGGCVTHAPTPTPTPTATQPPTPSQTPSPTPTATATATPSATPSTTGAPDEGNSLESYFLQGAQAACSDLASAANNQQLVDTQNRVIDTSNCASLVSRVRVNTSGLTTTAAAYKAGYQASLNLLFAHEPLCDPQNNCISKADLGS